MGEKPSYKTETAWWEPDPEWGEKPYDYAGVTKIDGKDYRVYAYLKEEKKPEEQPPPEDDDDVPF